jgi:dihydropyrimidinase
MDEMADFDIVIHSGALVSPAGLSSADLGIRNGRIAAWGSDLKGREMVDATGLLVLPGGVDAHVHLNMPTATTVTSEDWSSGTLAAAYGGTTTVLDFVEPIPGQDLTEALQQRQAEADGQAWVDYGLHMTLTDHRPETLAQIPGLVAAGVTSFKVYTTYGDMALDDVGLLAVMDAVQAAGGVLMVHAENDAIVQRATARLVAETKLEPRWHPDSRPAQAEVEAVQRMIQLAQVSGVNLYLVHLSTAGAVAAVSRARQVGQNLTAETCPQYLLLNRERFLDSDPEIAASFVCSPPLRTELDRQALWKALRSHDLQTVGTDHCAFTRRPQRQAGLHDFRQIPGGLPGIELRLALLYHFGVGSGKISLEDWVACCCANPARAFGIWPQKGSLAIGADADIVLFDPERTVEIQHDSLHEQVDYSPYEGFTLTGFPVLTILKGHKLIENGKLLNPVQTGQFLPCGLPEPNPSPAGLLA